MELKATAYETATKAFFAIVVLLCMALCLFMITGVQVVVTEGPSMEPTYVSGDHLLVVHDFTGVDEGDVVLIRRDGRLLVKRVIAVAGQEAVTAAIPIGQTTQQDSTITKPVYPEGLDEEAGTFTREELRVLRPWEFGFLPECETYSWGPWTSYHYWNEATVPEGYVFVAGDNLYDSRDSRDKSFGLVALSEIEGLVVWKFPGNS